MTSTIYAIRTFVVFFVLITSSISISAQTTVFTYQGHLQREGVPSSGSFDLEFRLSDSAVGGDILATQQVLKVLVTNGVFTASLDLGEAAFPGQPRFLEIAVRGLGETEFTTLSPRQQLASAPYAIKALRAATADDASQLGGLAPTSYVQLDKSGNAAIGGSLTVTGVFTADTVNAQTQYEIGGQRIMSNLGNSNLFVGTGSGASNTGAFNTFVGNLAGNSNTVGVANSFFGNTAGIANLSGTGNSFFGAGSGTNNVAGNDNAFFGILAGFNNTADHNSFFGSISGQSNTTGDLNAFFGVGSGSQNTTGRENAYFGANAGRFGSGGVANSIFGSQAGALNSGSFNSIFGRFAGQNNTASDNAFFGAGAGEQNTTGTNNTFVGTSVGAFTTTGSSNSFFGRNSGLSNNVGNGISLFGFQANVGAGNLTNATAIGSGAIVSSSNALVLGSNANVGIGTSTPQARFNVVGSSWFQGDTSPLPAAAGKGIIMGFSGEQGYISGFDYGTFTPKNLLLNLSGGNVGIGTTTPKAKLDVTGGNIIVGSPGQGIILRSPNGATCRLLAIDNAGGIALIAVACP